MKSDSSPEAGGAGLADKIANAKLQLERMLDLTPQMMMLIDGASRVVRCNRAILDLLGFEDFNEALGRSVAELFHPADLAGLDALLKTRGGCAVQEIRCVTRGGAERDLRFTMLNAGKDDPVIVVLVDDATGGRERAAQVEQGHKQDAIRALAGGLMHSLNQPLTVIMVKAAMAHMSIERGGHDAKAIQKALSEIMDETTKMSGVLKKIGDAREYSIEPYPGGLSIVNLEK